MRQLNVQEETALIQTLEQFETEELPKGFKNTQENGNKLIQVLDQQNYPFTLENFKAAARALVAGGHDLYASVEETAYEKIYSALKQNAKDVFGDYWSSSRSKHIIKTGIAGYLNATALINAMQGRTWEFSQLDFVLQYLTNKGALQFQPLQPQTDPRNLSGRVKGAFLSEEKNDLYKGGRLNHARKPGAEQQLPKSTSDAVLEAKANEVTGKTHSQTASIRRMFKTYENGTIDWQQTLALRLRAAGIQSIR